MHGDIDVYPKETQKRLAELNGSSRGIRAIPTSSPCTASIAASRGRSEKRSRKCASLLWCPVSAQKAKASGKPEKDPFSQDQK